MSLTDEINSWNQTPHYGVKYGSSYLEQVIGIRIERQYDQQAATCRITLPARYITITPNNHTEVKVYLGYSDDLVQVFSGYVDDVVLSRFPNAWDVVCRDRMKKAIDTWIEFDSEFVVSAPTQAETVISDLLALANLTVTAGTSSFTISDTNPAKFKGISVADAARQVAELIGWRLWCGVDGTIYFQHQRPLPIGTSYWTYEVGENVLEYEHTTTDRNLRNKIEVIGYQDIESTAYADSPHVNSPDYRAAIYSSELVDTQAMADTISARMVSELNHLTLSARVKAVGNPLIDVGKTIEFKDRGFEISGRYFVFGIAHTMDESNGFETEMTIVKPDDFVSNINYEPPEPPTPDEPPPDPDEPPIPPIGDRPTGDGSRVYIASSVGVVWTNTFLDAAPTWFTSNAGLSGDALNVFRFLFDPWSSVGGGYLGGAYIVTKDGVYKNTVLPDGTWTQVLSPAELASLIGANEGTAICQFSRELAPAITLEGYVAIAALRTLSDNTHRRYIVYSHDGGTTWSANTSDYIDSSGGNDIHGFSQNLFIYASNKAADRLYVSAWSGRWWAHPSSTSEHTKLFQSDDGGASLTDLGGSAPTGTGGSASGAVFLNFPYADQNGNVYADDERAWRTLCIDAVQETSTFPDPLPPSDWTTSPLLTQYPGTPQTCLMDIHTWNEATIYILPLNDNGIYITHDMGVTWDYVTDVSGNGNSNLFKALSALPKDELICMVANGSDGGVAHAYLTQDGGVTWEDRTGDINTVLSGITHIRSIVPDWIKVRDEVIVP